MRNAHIGYRKMIRGGVMSHEDRKEEAREQPRRSSGSRLLLWGALAGLGYLGWRVVRSWPASLHGQVALVTGGSRGLGLLLARELARHGCSVAICARDEAELLRARRMLESEGADVLALPCDVSEPQQVERLVEQVTGHFGRIDLLFNNASIIQVGPLETMDRDDFAQAMAVNFWGTVHATMAVLPQMRARKKGRIVNITSIGGKVSIPHLLPYGCAKFAAVGFSEGIGAELARAGVQVTTVVPGLMRTGSPVRALFKGQQVDEFRWFSLGDSLPLSAMSAERAARRIVQAVREGRSVVTLSWQARLLRLVHDLFPAATVRLLGWVNRLLPGAGGAGREQSEGIELVGQAGRAPWLKTMEQAGRRHNEYG